MAMEYSYSETAKKNEKKKDKVYELLYTHSCIYTHTHRVFEYVCT